MTMLERLRAARELISDPSRWTQGAFARHKNGRVIGARTPTACQWCAVGALYRFGAKTDSQEICLLQSKTWEIYRKPTMNFVGLNDQLGHIAVIQVYDAVIADLEAAQ